MRILIFSLVVLFTLSGCTGVITGYKYDPVKVYKVTKHGVAMYMTDEEIEDAQLDKANSTIEYAYSVIKEDEKK